MFGLDLTVPGGSNGQLQFNNAGAFGGNAAYTVDPVTGTIILGVPFTGGPAGAVPEDWQPWGYGVPLLVASRVATSFTSGQALLALVGELTGTGYGVNAAIENVSSWAYSDTDDDIGYVNSGNFQSDVRGSGTIAQVRGVGGGVTIGGSKQVTGVAAGLSYLTSLSGTVSSPLVYGFHNQVRFPSGSPAVTLACGVFIDWFTAGTPTIGTAIGLKINDQSTLIGVTTNQAINYADKFVVDKDGIVKAAGYKSSDGSAGVTAGPFTTITAVTVKNGLITSITGS